MGVARRPHSHPLPLPFRLGIPLQALHGDGSIHHCPKGLIVPSIQFLLKAAREATIELVPLLLAYINMSSSILGQVIELIDVVHHYHTPLSQFQELSQLLVEDTSRNIKLLECRGELLPGHLMIWLLHGMEGIPPCTRGPQLLLHCKAHFLLIVHIEQQKLLLQNAKPVLHIQV